MSIVTAECAVPVAGFRADADDGANEELLVGWKRSVGSGLLEVASADSRSSLGADGRARLISSGERLIGGGVVIRLYGTLSKSGSTAQSNKKACRQMGMFVAAAPASGASASAAEFTTVL